MDPEAAFLAGYALALVGLAAGLTRMGRRSTDPSASRMLAAGRWAGTMAPEDRKGLGWPHSEAPALHLGVSGVALAAALVLATAGVIRHHRPLELAVQMALLVLIAVRIASVVRQSRALSAPHRPPDPGQPVAGS